MAGAELHGTLNAGLGDTLAEVAAKSTYPLNLSILTDDDLSAADRPVGFGYTGPGAIALPPTRTVAINSNATIVTGIETAPQLEFLDRDNVLALADQVEHHLRLAGWTHDPTAAGVIGRAELRLRLVDPAAPEVTAWHLAVYRLGSARVTLRLRRLHRAGGDVPEDLFLLNLVWRDDALRRRARAIAEQLRVEDGVSMTRPRSVDARAYGRRVRALLRR